MERISIAKPDESLPQVPLLLIAPHGPDDLNTGVIVEEMSKQLNCYAVINNGFERSDKVDYFKDKADLNNIDHCKTDVIKDEFLKPITNAVKSILHKSTGASGMILATSGVYIFIIHGMMDSPDPQGPLIVAGYGANEKNNPHLYSMDPSKKDILLYTLNTYSPVKNTAFNGKVGGKYAGAGSKNLNQLHRGFAGNMANNNNGRIVNSLQLEIAYSPRSTLDKATATAMSLAKHTMVFFDIVLNKAALPAGWEKVAAGYGHYG